MWPSWNSRACPRAPVPHSRPPPHAARHPYRCATPLAGLPEPARHSARVKSQRRNKQALIAGAPSWPPQTAMPCGELSQAAQPPTQVRRATQQPPIQRDTHRKRSRKRACNGERCKANADRRSLRQQESAAGTKEVCFQWQQTCRLAKFVSDRQLWAVLGGLGCKTAVWAVLGAIRRQPPFGRFWAVSDAIRRQPPFGRFWAVSDAIRRQPPFGPFWAVSGAIRRQPP
jgi:hypothetical protein